MALAFLRAAGQNAPALCDCPSGHFKRMHYHVDGVVVHSENAAKPAAQPSRYLVAWLDNYPAVEAALDYGCGKLRYEPTLLRRSESLTLVDSAVQLERVQLLLGQRTSIRELVKATWPNAATIELREFWTRTRPLADFVLCANVLSAIPSAKVRSVSLQAIHTSLKKEGECLFAHQYRNSEFGRTSHLRTAVPHAQGWLLKGPHGASYYGLWPLDRTVRAVRQHGFSVREAWRHGESSYVLARRTVS